MTIKEEILRRADHYATTYDEVILRNNDIKMKSPVLFVLLGDRVSDGLEAIIETMNRNIMNAEGAVYLLVGSQSEETAKITKNEINKRNVISLALPQNVEEMDRETIGKLTSEEDFLYELNDKVLEVKRLILEKNKVFSYWEQMNVSFVTAASDKTNSLLPDLVVLLRNKLEQDFKQVFTDLFVILEETDVDSTPFNKALALSLFKELDLYQKPDYCYEKEVEVLEDGIKLKANNKRQLFNLVYLLTDKKENGQKIAGAKKVHYESIVAVNLLKNREQKHVELEEAREQYNYNVFASSIQDSSQNRYCVARLAKVRKPGVGIYLAVAYHLFRAYKAELSYESKDKVQNEIEDRSLLEVVGLSDEKLKNLVANSMPEESDLKEIHSLIARNIGFKELKSVSFKEAEELLYGESAKNFFKNNFEKLGEKHIKDSLSNEQLKDKLIKEVVNSTDYGPYAIDHLLHSNLLKTLEIQREKYVYEAKKYENELEEKATILVGERIGGTFSVFDKKYVREVKDYFINEIYKKRYAYLLQKLKIKAMDIIRDNLEHFYEELKDSLNKLEDMETMLLSLLQEANKYEEEYLVQNVKEYYETLVKQKLFELEKSKGTFFLFDEKYIGPIAKVAHESESNFLERLFDAEEALLLSDEKLFGLSFEEELLARANMLVEYEDKEVVAKSELYALLYESLEENSKPCVHLDTTLSPHRYVEKYFFGDRRSEFVKYAYKRDQSSRSYKIGTINDERNSVIEKLQLMGGFRLQDLIFTRSAERYYEAYKEKGYRFHIKETEEAFEGGEKENGK